MQAALLSSVFQGAIPHFPASTGFGIINFVQSCRHPRDAVVLCYRNESGVDEFVVWTANMIEGGCHVGSYCSTFDQAWTEFQRRVGSLS
jgi:hypothetical protein